MWARGGGNVTPTRRGFSSGGIFNRLEAQMYVFGAPRMDKKLA